MRVLILSGHMECITRHNDGLSRGEKEVDQCVKPPCFAASSIQSPSRSNDSRLHTSYTNTAPCASR